MNKIALFCAQNFKMTSNMGGGDGSVHPCLGSEPPPHWHFSRYGPTPEPNLATRANMAINGLPE